MPWALFGLILLHTLVLHSKPIKRDTTSCMGQARQGLLWNTKPTQHAIVAIQVYTQYSDNNQGRYIAPNTARQWRDILDTIIESGLTKIALNYCPRQERVPKAHTFPLFLPPLAAAAVLPAALLPAARWQRQWADTRQRICMGPRMQSMHAQLSTICGACDLCFWQTEMLRHDMCWAPCCSISILHCLFCGLSYFQQSIWSRHMKHMTPATCKSAPAEDGS